jgi:hypothetical protein
MRDKLLQEIAEAVAAEWLEDSARAKHFGIAPSSARRWVTASNILANWYSHDLQQFERHHVVHVLAPAALERMRLEAAA